MTPSPEPQTDSPQTPRTDRLRIVRYALKGARGLALDADELGLDVELGNALDIVDALLAEAAMQSSPVDLRAALERLASGIQASLTIRLIAGDTNQSYTPNEVATMVAAVVDEQLTRLLNG